MRAEPWLDEIRHGIKPAISCRCDYCATTRRKRNVVYLALFGPAVDKLDLAEMDFDGVEPAATGRHPATPRLSLGFTFMAI